MKITKHVVFGAKSAPELEVYLQQNSIPYDKDSILIAFDILSTNPHWPTIEAFVKQYDLTCRSVTSFTKKELLDAEWLRIRSKWRNGYPQPESGFGYRNTTFSTKDFCDECGIGLSQVNSFRLKATPKWGSRHVFTLDWVDDELFVDDIAMHILQHSELSGFHFLPVNTKNGSMELPGVHQLMIESTSRPGLLLGNADIDNVYRCEICGSHKYHPTGIGMHTFSKQSLSDMPDICHSYESFGWGHGADRLILIRQSMYRTLVDNHLDRSLVFEPIKLV